MTNLLDYLDRDHREKSLLLRSSSMIALRIALEWCRSEHPLRNMRGTCLKLHVENAELRRFQR